MYSVHSVSKTLQKYFQQIKVPVYKSIPSHLSNKKYGTHNSLYILIFLHKFEEVTISLGS